MKEQPDEFIPEMTTIWNFPERGTWATHSGIYPGNWSPYVPRNLILKYTKKGDWVLDQFMGSGTTIVEGKLLNRNVIGVDINEEAVCLTEKNINFPCESTSKVYVLKGSALDLDFVKNDSIDLICTHPPYANIIKYSDNAPEDLSNLCVDDFMTQLTLVASESLRVLKKNHSCAIMMGDMRYKGKVVPLGFKVMNCFMDVGFKIKEIIIKQQHNCKSNQYWRKREINFYLLEHEYIFVFEK